MPLQPDTASRQLTPAASCMTRRHVITTEAADLVHRESHASPVIPGGKRADDISNFVNDRFADFSGELAGDSGFGFFRV